MQIEKLRPFYVSLRDHEREFKYLRLLFTSIYNIKPNYYKSEGRYEKQKLERVFCYELYFQLKYRMLNNIYCYNSIISGEIGKSGIVWDQLFLGQSENEYRIDYIFPDLVIHKGQSDTKIENQKLIIEAKCNNYDKSDIVKDLVKLINTLNHLHFQFAVFLSINTDFKKLKDKISLWFDFEKFNKEEKRLAKYLLIVNTQESGVIEFCSLYEIVKKTAANTAQSTATKGGRALATR